MLLDGFVVMFGSPEFNSYAFCKQPTGQPFASWDVTFVIFVSDTRPNKLLALNTTVSNVSFKPKSQRENSHDTLNLVVLLRIILKNTLFSIASLNQNLMFLTLTKSPDTFGFWLYQGSAFLWRSVNYQNETLKSNP